MQAITAVDGKLGYGGVDPDKNIWDADRFPAGSPQSISSFNHNKNQSFYYLTWKLIEIKNDKKRCNVG